MKPIFSSFVFPLCLALAGCNNQQTTSPQPAPTPPPSIPQPSVNKIGALPPFLQKLPNLECRKQGKNLECISGDYKITAHLNGCTPRQGFYGAMIGLHSLSSVTLYDVPSSAAGPGRPVARLGNDQFVCTDAYASIGREIQWYYVMAIPSKTVKGCSGKSLCRDLPIEWIEPSTEPECHLTTHGTYMGRCAAGWVRTDEFNEFSMGIE